MVAGGTEAAFEYVAWFEDPRMPENDEDREWPAVFIVVAPSRDAAHEWGDHLARGRAERAKELFLRSSVEPHLCHRDQHDLPTVTHGSEASDELIGW